MNSVKEEYINWIDKEKIELEKTQPVLYHNFTKKAIL
jgi:hypothetical protein